MTWLIYKNNDIQLGVTIVQLWLIALAFWKYWLFNLFKLINVFYSILKNSLKILLIDSMNKSLSHKTNKAIVFPTSLPCWWLGLEGFLEGKIDVGHMWVVDCEKTPLLHLGDWFIFHFLKGSTLRKEGHRLTKQRGLGI